MAYGSGNSNIKMTPLSLTDANAWRDVFGWEINDGGASVDVGMAYSTVGWVNRCVHLRAGALKELPWSLMKGDSEIANSESEDYSFLPWLESLPDLLYLAESALCITGTAYIGKVRNRGKRIEDLRWFAPSTMEPIWSPVDGLIGYKRTIGSMGGSVSVQPWSIENIIYFHILNPLHETEPGASPVAAALLDAQVIYNLNQYSSLFFQRGAIKPTLLTVEGMPPPAERERLKAWWQRAFSGVKNAFNTEIISASVKPIVVGEGLEALNNNSLTEEKREAISTALGVPHSMVMSNASNFATAEADRLNLYDTTIIPRAKTIANSLNRQLFTELGYRIVFKPESLSIYQEDEEQRAAALVQLVNAGMKLSVAAEILGIGLPDGVTYESLDEAKQQADAAQQALLDAQLAKYQQNGAQSNNAQDASQPKESAVDNTQAKTKEAAQFRKWLKKRDNADIHMFKAEYLSHDELHEIADNVREVATEQPFFTLPETFTRDSVKALLLMNPDDDEAEQKIRMELERRSARNIDKAFTEMVNTLYPAGYDGFGGAFIDPNIEASRIQRAFREEQALRDAVSRALIDSADLGVSIGIAQLESVGIGFDYLLAHTAARDFAIAYTDTLLEQMANTSGKLVGRTVARWFDNGENLEQLIQDLEPVFGRKRAERIASTEVTRAAAEGSRLAYIESGVVEKVQWRTARDERTCPVCAPLEGKHAGLDGNFNGVSVPAHPGCRCWIVPVVDDVKEKTLSENSEITQKVIGSPRKETLSAISSELKKINKDFPELDNWVRKFDFETITKASEGMSFDAEEKALYLQKNLSKMLPDAISSYMATDSMVGNGSFESSIIHEIGHALDRNITIRLRSLRDIQDEYINEINNLKKNTGKISEYGNTNRREYVAELFTAERLGIRDKKQLQDIFRKYINILHQKGLALADWSDVPQ